LQQARRVTSQEPTSRQLFLYFLRLGTVGFGGLIALAGYMQKELVDERHWITPEEYKEGLALAQLAPGPLAAQLAIYLGWVRHGVLSFRYSAASASTIKNERATKAIPTSVPP